jgi:NitT/TauT family transport system substrate-binding protein
MLHKPFSVLAFSAVLLANCGGRSPATSRLPVKIAVGGREELIYLPVTLSQELGYNAEEGIDVTLLDFTGGAKALEAMLGGSADVSADSTITPSRWPPKAGSCGRLWR